MSSPLLRSRTALQSLRSRSTTCNSTRRYASTSSTSTGGGFRLFAYGSATLVGAVVGYIYVTDTRSAFHHYLVPPALRALFPDAEDAHHFGTAALKSLYSLGLHPRERARLSPDPSDPNLSAEVFGVKLDNPIGISAGLDKDADIPDALFALGAGVVEVGGCTPKPQPGNPKPRVWRVPSIEGMVNCYGLNSVGADAMAMKLRQRLRVYAHSQGLEEEDVLSGNAGVPVGSLTPGRLLLVQVAKNKETPEKDAVADYAYCASRLAQYADVLVVNVSSPNTAGLRDLQSGDKLVGLLDAVVGAVRASTKGIRATPPKVMVKVSPDEDSDAQVKDIVRAVWESGVDGVIVGNTTRRKMQAIPAGVPVTNREKGILMMADGGFSGPSMYGRTLDLVKKYRKWLDVPSFKGKKVIFATGGITNGKEAAEIREAGADVAMVYTGLVYGGSGTVTRIKDEMRREIKGDKKE
ncbi:related to orotate reductase (NADH2) [Cephalotrichum gorgonifer]|uniref:Related to orotate reductase (NADH2) n=1 Tax=Cephalotrichum gorgonifer TaxID=2041049 RepID=A0AAE8SRQ2_9PEZI|nr:related to orotate reductase (NADH2) [Cephalotrichum gorgonifer]